MLVVIGADPFLAERIGAFYLPYPVSFHSSLPDLRRAETVVLTTFPAGAEIAKIIPRAVPFIACGDSKFIAAAFRSGASDYLCDPWTEDEFTERVRRLFQRSVLHMPALNAVLQGTRLIGPRGTVPMSHEEAQLLRILYRENGKDVSRVALRRLLWPRATEASRIVDETVSRLRERLDNAGISKSSMEIRSVRGFGYRMELSN